MSQINPVLLVVVLLLATTEKGISKAVFGSQYPRYQKNYWYEYSSPPSTSYPEYIDYHLSPEPPVTSSPNLPRILVPVNPLNVTTQLGSPVSLHCVVRNLQDKTVSWLRRRPGQDVPLLLTFGETVYVSDVRFSIRRSNEDWILDILHAKTEDEAIYECQVSTEPPKIHKISLAVEAPILTVMDGFGRELLDQYYKVGSSLEVMCQVDRLPARPLPDIIEWRHGSSKLPKSNSTSGQSVRTELLEQGAISRLAISQADIRHSGVYTCAVSDNISQSLRLHIIDESKPVPIINNQASSLHAAQCYSCNSFIASLLQGGGYLLITIQLILNLCFH